VGASPSVTAAAGLEGPFILVSAYTHDAIPGRKITTEVYRKLFDHQGTMSKVFDIQRVTASGKLLAGHWTCPACIPQVWEPKYPALAKILKRSESGYTKGQRILQKREITALTAVCAVSVNLYHLLIL
jgi:hypothetical protein